MEKSLLMIICIILIIPLTSGIFIYHTLETEMKLWIAIVVTSLILLQFFLLINYRRNFKVQIVKLPFLGRMLFPLFYFFVILSIVVIPPMNSQLLVWDQIPLANYLRLFSSLLIAFILPGFVIIRALSKSLSVIESLPFSFLISIFVTFISGVDFTFLISINLCLLLFSFYITLKCDGTQYYININIVKIGVLLCVFLLFFLGMISMYSNFWLFIGPDVWRHYGWILNILKGVPEIPIFGRSFHILYASFLQLSGFPYINAYISSIPFAFIAVLSFYLMASKYLEDEGASCLSALIWAFFSGFSWIYTIYLKFTTNSNWYEILSLVESKTLLDIGYPPGFWHIMGDNMPAAIGIIALFSLLYLIRLTEIDKKLQCFLFIIIFVTGFSIHPTETTFFFTTIPILMILKKRMATRDMFFSIFLACLLIIILDFGYQFIHFNRIFLTTYISIYATSMLVISLIGFLFTFIPIRIHLHSSIIFKIVHFPNNYIKNHLTTLVSVLLIYLSGLGILAWFEIKDSFNWWDTLPNIFVPWYFYPLRLGVIGLIMLHVFLNWRELLKNLRDVFIFLIFFLIFIFSFGRFNTYIMVNFPSYDLPEETRMLAFLFIPLAMLTSKDLYFIFKKIFPSFNASIRSLKEISLRRWVVGISLLTIVTTFGLFSTLMTVEFWNLTSKTYQPIGFSEFPAMEYLRNNTDPALISNNVADYNLVFTLTDLSYQILNFFSGTGTYEFYYYKGRVLFDAINPEESLYLLSYYKTKYFYLGQRDDQYLSYKSNNFIYSYLLDNLHISFKDESARIYEVPIFSPPLPNSNTAIIIPSSSKYSTSIYNTMSMFALSQANYTTIMDNDNNLFLKDTLILQDDQFIKIFDEFQSNNSQSQAPKIIQWVENGGHLMIMASEGRDIFSDILKIQVLNSNFTVDKIANNTNSITIPSINVKPIMVADQAIKVLANYSNIEGDVSPFAIKKEIGDGELIYVYVEPYFSAMKTIAANENQRVLLFNKLGLLLKVSNLNTSLSNEKIVKECSTTLYKADLTGTIELQSSSIILPNLIDFPQQEINTYGSTEWIIHADDLEIKPSDSSFYSKIAIKGGFDFIMYVNNTLITKVSGKTELMEFLARTPEISVNGTVILHTAFIDEGIAAYYWGNEVIINGLSTFKVEYSDTFTLLSNFQGNYKMQILTSETWDEWGAVPWFKIITSYTHICFVLSLIIFITMFYKIHVQGITFIIRIKLFKSFHAPLFYLKNIWT